LYRTGAYFPPKCTLDISEDGGFSMRPVALNVREKEAISRANEFRGPFTLFSKYQVLGKSETIKNKIVDISDLFRYTELA